ncbi:hypothetical protein I7331_39955, partial [Frankia sp. AgB1.8]|nr:hypothetical protein [Frankia sp. AgB1.8]
GGTDAAGAAGAAGRRARGGPAAAGAATARARAAADDLEATTDRLASPAWDALEPAMTERAATLLAPIAQAAAPLLMWPNPVGVPDPRAQAQADRDERLGS